MRVITTLATLCWAVSAQAQTVPNGDFETGDLTSWTDDSSSFCGGIGLCQDGEAYVLSEADAGVPLPGDFALALYTGDVVGFQTTRGAVLSSAFLVTRTRLEWIQVSESAELQLRVTAFDANGNEVGRVEPPAVVDQAVTQDIDVSGACGRNMSFEVRAEPYQAPGDWETTQGVAVFDSFALVGDPCPQLVDEDGDGFCENGIDLDGNGDCADEGEPTLDPQDCNDDAPWVNPDAVDVPGNGIDEDCDGADAVGGTATGGTATGGTATGGTATGTATGGTNPEQVSDSGTGYDEIKASGAGCGCDAGGGGSTGWLALLALIGLRRRR